MAKRFIHSHRVMLDDVLMIHVREAADRDTISESAAIRQMVAASLASATRRAAIEAEIEGVGALT